MTASGVKIECVECEGSGIITSRFQMSAYVGPQTMDPPDYDQFDCEYCGGTGMVHRANGEYLGDCDCPTAKAIEARKTENHDAQ